MTCDMLASMSATLTMVLEGNSLFLMMAVTCFGFLLSLLSLLVERGVCVVCMSLTQTVWPHISLPIALAHDQSHVHCYICFHHICEQASTCYSIEPPFYLLVSGVSMVCCTPTSRRGWRNRRRVLWRTFAVTKDWSQHLHHEGVLLPRIFILWRWFCLFLIWAVLAYMRGTSKVLRAVPLSWPIDKTACNKLTEWFTSLQQVWLPSTTTQADMIPIYRCKDDILHQQITCDAW